MNKQEHRDVDVEGARCTVSYN